jgi:hypothetical protein
MTEDILEVPTYEWGDMYLKFSSEEEANEVLEGYLGAVDTIGVIFKASGTPLTDEDGNTFPLAEAIEGWHVNTRGPMLPDLLPFAITPTNPVRVWA